MVITFFLKKSFFLLCLVGAIWRIYLCFDSFMADESISSVKYRKFLESSEDAYPALTICFNIPFYEEKLKEYKVDLATYVRMLRGENITKFQEDDNEDYFDVFGPEDPIIPDLNITQKLYSIPYEEVSFGFKEDHFSIASYINYEN